MTSPDDMTDHELAVRESACSVIEQLTGLDEHEIEALLRREHPDNREADIQHMYRALTCSLRAFAAPMREEIQQLKAQRNNEHAKRVQLQEDNARMSALIVRIANEAESSAGRIAEAR